MLACLCVYSVGALLPALAPQPLLYLALRCVTGVCCCCVNISSFSLGNNTLSFRSFSPPPASVGARPREALLFLWGQIKMEMMEQESSLQNLLR